MKKSPTATIMLIAATSVMAPDVIEHALNFEQAKHLMDIEPSFDEKRRYIDYAQAQRTISVSTAMALRNDLDGARS